MRSYSFKNFILAAGLVMLCFIILGASFVSIGRNYMLRERKKSIEENAYELSRLTSAYLRDGKLESWDYRITLTAISRSTGNHCFITDADGAIVCCSDMEMDCGHAGTRMPEGVMEQLLTSGSYSSLTTLGGFYDEAHYVAALPVLSYDSGVIGCVFAASDASRLVHAWGSLMNIFLVAAFSIMVLALILTYVMSRVRSRPINEMADAALKFGHGDFSARVSGVGRDDEIGALSAAFNQMAESLEQSEKRRSDFIANVAHELKTPMTTISGFADGILDGTIPPEQQRRYLATISAETKRLNRLVRSMLELSRMQSAGSEEVRSRSFDAVDVLAQTLVLFEQKINERRLDVDALIPEDPMLVYGDADAINQVIYNLLENAVKFSEPGSVLGVRLFKQGEKAYVAVKNHGPTIPEEELPLIFDRFHKGDKSRSMDREGYGLGLYIVKTILNRHGEDIAVTSRDGVTEFVFSLTLKTK